jgi:hypothetical protein
MQFYWGHFGNPNWISRYGKNLKDDYFEITIVILGKKWIIRSQVLSIKIENVKVSLSKWVSFIN